MQCGLDNAAAAALAAALPSLRRLRLLAAGSNAWDVNGIIQLLTAVQGAGCLERLDVSSATPLGPHGMAQLVGPACGLRGLRRLQALRLAPDERSSCSQERDWQAVLAALPGVRGDLCM